MEIIQLVDENGFDTPEECEKTLRKIINYLQLDDLIDLYIGGNKR